VSTTPSRHRWSPRTRHRLLKSQSGVLDIECPATTAELQPRLDLLTPYCMQRSRMQCSSQRVCSHECRCRDRLDVFFWAVTTQAKQHSAPPKKNTGLPLAGPDQARCLRLSPSRPTALTGAGAGSRGQCRLAACPAVPQGALPVSDMPWGSEICP
jgi:hypothetical protein